MSRYTKEKIYELLPSIYRIKDKDQGEPLKALLEIISEQVELLEKDIDQLYLNYTIETCDESRVPYIGDLLNAQILNPVTRVTSSHRSWVANTLSYRRRKGTLATLEQLSRDVTGWNCRAVEFFQNLVTTQYLNHIRIKAKATIDLRNNDFLELIGTPFDTSTHTLDVRHIDSKRGYYNVPNIGIFLWRLQAYPVIKAPAFSLGDGKYTFSQLGYDLPIYNHPVTETSIDHIATELNIPTRIRRIALEKSLEIYRSERNFPYHESIKIFKSIRRAKGRVVKSQVLPEDIVVCDLSNWHHRPPLGKVAIDPKFGRMTFQKSEKIVDVHVSYYYGFSSEMGGGFYDRGEPGQMKGSPVPEPRDHEIYYYMIGKGNPEAFHSLSQALEKWKSEQFQTKRDAIFEFIDSESYSDADSHKYSPTNPIVINIPENITLTIRSQNFQRPVLRFSKPLTIKGNTGGRIIFDGLLFVHDDEPGDSSVDQSYANNSTLLKIDQGNLSELVINHCTLVPERDPEDMGKLLFSWQNIPQVQREVKRLKMYLFDILGENWIKQSGVVFKKGTGNNSISVLSPGKPNPSLKLELKLNLDTQVTASTPITSGRVSMKKRIMEDQHTYEYLTIYELPMLKQSNNSIKVYSPKYSIGLFGDGTESNNNHSLKISINRSITGRIESMASGAALKLVDSIVDGKGEIEAIRCTSAIIENSTVFGKVTCVVMGLASNSIFTDTLNIDRRQQGCLRFCFIPSGSQIPRPYRCILEDESSTKVSSISKDIDKTVISIAPDMAKGIPRQIRPQFTSKKYGDDGYGQLHKNVEKVIFEGGDNGSEIGAFNHLFNPQRIKNLSSAIGEYLKFGLEAGIFLVT
jgi:hypothetical protein